MVPTALPRHALLVALLVGSTPAQATEYHVAEGGAGTGTAADPFGTIQEGLDAAQPGDTVIVAAGTYTESLQTVRDGIDGAPIVLRGDTTDGPVVVTTSGRVLRVDHAHAVFEDLVVDGQYGDADAVDVNDGAHHLVLRRCEVVHSGRDCVDMGAPTDVLIEGCLIHHCLNSDGGRTDAHGVTGGAVGRLTLRDTEIHSFSGDGVQFDPGRELPGWDDVVIEGCHIWLEPLPQAENGFAAGTVPGENAVDTKTHNDAPRASLVIRDSVFSGFRGGLISNMAALNLKENIDATLDRVTLWDNEIALRLRGPTSDHPAGSWVRAQNVVIYDVGAAVRYEDDIENLRLWHLTLGGDVIAPFVEASSDNSVLDVRNLLLLGTTLPAEAVGGSNLVVDGDAFVNAVGHDYHLEVGSPAIDQGEAIPEVTLDHDAVSRPQGAAPDVGAYEWCETCVPQTQVDAGVPQPQVDGGPQPQVDGGPADDPDSPSTGCGCHPTADLPPGGTILLLALWLALWLAHRIRPHRREPGCIDGLGDRLVDSRPLTTSPVSFRRL